MHSGRIHVMLTGAVLGAALAALPSCGSEQQYDWKNREIPWTYGPTTGTARPEHLSGTGTTGGDAISKGWKCRLSDGSRLTVAPFELAESHELFGKAGMNVGLFDRHGEQLDSRRSEAITAENATFTFEIDAEVGKQLHDLVIWFVPS